MDAAVCACVPRGAGSGAGKWASGQIVRIAQATRVCARDVQTVMIALARGTVLLASVALALPLMAQGKQATTGAGARLAAPPCKASDLSLGTDDENGSFNGMSHLGTLLVLRNLSTTACSVPARPEISFLDASKSKASPLPIKLEIPGAKFMHPGPVMLPVWLRAPST